MKLINRDSIARDIEYKVFKTTVWDLIFPDAREGISFVSGRYYSDQRLYEKMYNNVRMKVRILGGELKEVWTKAGKRRKILDYKTSPEVMGEAMSKQLPITFKIMIRNKYYEFTVKH